MSEKHAPKQPTPSQQAEWSEQRVADYRASLVARAAVAWALVLFGFPASCFGCVAMWGSQGDNSLILPVLVVLYTVFHTGKWHRDNSKLPKELRGRGATVAMGLLAALLGLAALAALILMGV